jgi:hypothetical protein
MAAPIKSAKLNIDNLKFDGNKAKYAEWMENVTLYMIGNPDQFPDDQRKVTFTLSYMTGSNSVKLWKSSKQKEYLATAWPTWTDFKQALEEDFGDPAAEANAREYLRTYKQGATPARKFFSSLELWFSFANVTDAAEKLEVTKKSMNPALRSSLTLVGFPTSYTALKAKMISLEDEDRKMETGTNPRAMDSRLADPGSSFQRRPPQATYRAQGIVPARPHNPPIGIVTGMAKPAGFG